MKKHVSSSYLPTSGFPCPECSNPIVITIPMLISHEEVFCGVCGLKLVVDQEKSKESLEDLQKVQQSHDEVINSE